MPLSQWIVGLAAGVAIFLGLHYLNYLRSRSLVGSVYGAMAQRLGGTFSPGSFFKPPLVRFPLEGAHGVLTSFYLYRGKTGHYLQVCLSLEHRYLHAFVITSRAGSDDAACSSDVRIESVRPELAQELVSADWSGPLEALGFLDGKQDIEIRFDGDRLLVRRRGLIFDAGTIEEFVRTVVSLLPPLVANAGPPIGSSADMP